MNLIILTFYHLTNYKWVNVYLFTFVFIVVLFFSCQFFKIILVMADLVLTLWQTDVHTDTGMHFTW